ncbi:hypothetical protein [Streptomyces bungoensis]|uniref:hypothetical protein n=1 Tax=Streptomyces bungoensis TaxID=285568 RepID=UPI0034089393
MHHTPIPALPFLTLLLPALLLSLITAVLLRRRQLRPNPWLLTTSAGFACTALAAALEHPHHPAVPWVPLSGMFLVLALTSRTTGAPQADDQTHEQPPVSLTKDEPQP